MTGLIRRIAIRQILPGRAGAQDPKDAVQHVPRIPPRSATPVRASLLLEERLNDLPLLVGQIHAARYDGSLSTVYEIASSLQ